MRFSLYSLELLGPVLAVPVVVWWCGCSARCVLALGLLPCLLHSLALGWHVQVRPRYKKVTLETFGISHFCEKSRWVLDRLGVDYEEEMDMGVIGMLLLGRSLPCLHVPHGGVGSRSSSINNSYDIARFLAGYFPHEEWLRLDGETTALEREFDTMGHAVQQWAYCHVLSQPVKQCLRVWGFEQPQVPRWQKAIARAVCPFVKLVMIFHFKASSPNAPARIKAKQVIRASFERVGARLADGRPFLTGSRFHYTDIAFCSLASLALCPDPADPRQG